MTTDIPIKRMTPPQGARSPPSTPATTEEDGFTKILTKEEKRKLRKVERHRPSFSFDVGQFRNGKKIGVAHVRELVLYLVADGQRPLWLVAEHKGNINHTVLLMIPGLLPSHLGLEIPLAANNPFTTSPIYPSSSKPVNRVPYLTKMFSYGVPVRAPGDGRRMFSVMNTLFNSPLPEGMRKEKEKEEKRIAESAKGDNATPLLYLLSPNQMIDNDYRIPSYINSGEVAVIPGKKKGKSTVKIPQNGHLVGSVEDDLEVKVDSEIPIANGSGDWVETREATEPPDDVVYPVLAMDCEMVETSKGVQLARVSIVDYHTGESVFDELVKPPDPVTDYRTRWSGMTPERLSTATLTLSSIQSALSTGPNPLITPHTVLLGHSLECDLTAIKLKHPLCIDTALLYKHPKGPPYKPALKWLASRYLSREIQNKDGGHDSFEDALTCVDLLRMKMLNGPDFGSNSDTTESIFDRISRFIPSLPKSSLPTSESEEGKGKTTAVLDYSNSKTGHGGKATTSIKCNDDDEVLEGILDNVEKHDFVFGRFLELGNVQGWNGEQNIPSPSELDLDQSLANLNNRLEKLHNSLPKNAALIIMTGHSDPLPMLELTSKRQKWERLVKELGGADGINGEDRWLVEDDRELEKSVAEAREGMGFFCVK